MPELGVLEQNTAAMNRLAAAIELQNGGKGGKPAATAATPADGKRGPGRPKRVSLDDVKAVAEELMAEKGKPAAVALIKKHGADSLRELDEAQYAKFIAAARTILNDEGDDGDGEGDDDSL